MCQSTVTSTLFCRLMTVVLQTFAGRPAQLQLFSDVRAAHCTTAVHATAFKEGQAVYGPPTGGAAALCETCADARLPKCAKCGTACNGQVVKVNTLIYHPDCLKCSSCSEQIQKKGRRIAKALAPYLSYKYERPAI